jgi:hypothetical protein
VHIFINEISKVKSDYLKLIISTIFGIACGDAWMTNIRYFRIGIYELFLIFKRVVKVQFHKMSVVVGGYSFGWYWLMPL